MAFDRAVDVSAFDGSQLTVDDEPNGNRYDGAGGAFTLTPTVIEVGLVAIGTSGPGPQALLDATALTGIVAQDDGGTWAGVTGLVLPWP